MSAITSIVAGIVTVSGLVALTRMAQRKAAEIRKEFDVQNGVQNGAQNPERAPREPVIDYERDPVDGVYRARP